MEALHTGPQITLQYWSNTGYQYWSTRLRAVADYPNTGPIQVPYWSPYWSGHLPVWRGPVLVEPAPIQVGVTYEKRRRTKEKRSRKRRHF